jgi:hypothetical protein
MPTVRNAVNAIIWADGLLMDWTCVVNSLTVYKIFPHLVKIVTLQHAMLWRYPSSDHHVYNDEASLVSFTSTYLNIVCVKSCRCHVTAL